jgi:glutaredoxin
MSEQTTAQSGSPADVPRATEITLVHAEACHFCTDAGEVLEDLGHAFAIDVHLVRADSEEGRALVAVHRPAMSPLVVVDGQFFSHGRLPRKKLTRLLEARSRALAGMTHGN